MKELRIYNTIKIEPGIQQGDFLPEDIRQCITPDYIKELQGIDNADLSDFLRDTLSILISTDEFKGLTGMHIANIFEQLSKEVLQAFDYGPDLYLASMYLTAYLRVRIVQNIENIINGMPIIIE